MKMEAEDAKREAKDAAREQRAIREAVEEAKTTWRRRAFHTPPCCT